jgi:hypothetical protein
MNSQFLSPTKAFLLTLFGLALLANSGCSTLHIDKPQVENTKKVAIVGFCVRQEIPQTLTGALLGTGTDHPGFTAEMCTDKPHAATMYRDFAVSFHPEWKFTVLDRETVAKNPAYMALHKKYTEGWQSRPPSHGGKFECYRAEGILDPYPIRNLSLEERANLMRALGVDRIAVAEVETHVENTSMLKGLVGAADFATSATVKFQMYTANEPKAIWSDTNAKGETAGKVNSVMGVHSQEALDQQAVQTSKSAYQALAARAKK